MFKNDLFRSGLGVPRNILSEMDATAAVAGKFDRVGVPSIVWLSKVDTHVGHTALVLLSLKPSKRPTSVFSEAKQAEEFLATTVFHSSLRDFHANELQPSERCRFGRIPTVVLRVRGERWTLIYQRHRYILA